MLYSLVGIVIFILDIIAIVDVINSSMDGTKKLIWILAILFLPLLGMLLYFAIGRK